MWIFSSHPSLLIVLIQLHDYFYMYPLVREGVDSGVIHYPVPQPNSKSCICETLKSITYILYTVSVYWLML